MICKIKDFNDFIKSEMPNIMCKIILSENPLEFNLELLLK